MTKVRIHPGSGLGLSLTGTSGSFSGRDLGSVRRHYQHLFWQVGAQPRTQAVVQSMTGSRLNIERDSHDLGLWPGFWFNVGMTLEISVRP